jgi:hypothetical protein
MWQQYRKTFWPMQAFIALLCVVAYVFAKMPLPAVVFLCFTLELGSVAGAWWGTRIRRQLERNSKRLPLER